MRVGRGAKRGLRNKQGSMGEEGEQLYWPPHMIFRLQRGEYRGSIYLLRGNNYDSAMVALHTALSLLIYVHFCFEKSCYGQN